MDSIADMTSSTSKVTVLSSEMRELKEVVAEKIWALRLVNKLLLRMRVAFDISSDIAAVVLAYRWAG